MMAYGVGVHVYIMTYNVGVHAYITLTCSMRVYIYVMIWDIEIHEFTIFPIYAYKHSNFDEEFYLLSVYTMLLGLCLLKCHRMMCLPLNILYQLF